MKNYFIEKVTSFIIIHDILKVIEGLSLSIFIMVFAIILLNKIYP